MSYFPWLELVYKISAVLCGALSLYIGISRIIRTRESKRKRNASHVPK